MMPTGHHAGLLERKSLGVHQTGSTSIPLGAFEQMRATRYSHWAPYSQDLRERVFAAAEGGGQIGQIARGLRVSVS
jgi:hypothetical protein